MVASVVRTSCSILLPLVDVPVVELPGKRKFLAPTNRSPGKNTNIVYGKVVLTTKKHPLSLLFENTHVARNDVKNVGGMVSSLRCENVFVRRLFMVNEVEMVFALESTVTSKNVSTLFIVLFVLPQTVVKKSMLNITTTSVGEILSMARFDSEYTTRNLEFKIVDVLLRAMLCMGPLPLRIHRVAEKKHVVVKVAIFLLRHKRNALFASLPVKSIVTFDKK